MPPIPAQPRLIFLRGHSNLSTFYIASIPVGTTMGKRKTGGFDTSCCLKGLHVPATSADLTSLSRAATHRVGSAVELVRLLCAVSNQSMRVGSTQGLGVSCFTATRDSNSRRLL
jgi:hypothetical protein